MKPKTKSSPNQVRPAARVRYYLPADKKLCRGASCGPNFGAYTVPVAYVPCSSRANAERVCKFFNLSEGEQAVVIAEAIKKEWGKSKRAGRTFNLICAAYQVMDSAFAPRG